MLNYFALFALSALFLFVVSIILYWGLTQIEKSIDKRGKKDDKTKSNTKDPK